MNSIQHYIKKLDRNQWMAVIAVVGIVAVGGLLYANQNGGISLGFGMSNAKIAQMSIDYINNNKLSQTPATLVDGSITSESGLVKFKISIGGNAFDSYATKDGKLLMPQAFNMSGTATASTGTDNPTATPTVKPADLTKVDNPMLEAYIVSRCPFGLQMQRAMANAIAASPDLAKHVTVRYMGAVDGSATGINSMHGDAEAKENLRQICIREEQPAKYWEYSACQMKDGDTAGCEKSTGVDSAKLNSCLTDKSRGIAYAKKDFDLNTKYNIQGSPTLILGDAQISEFDFGGRSADAIRSIICAASKTESAFCSKTLDTAPAATSFSLTYAGSGTAATAGGAAANCAPAQ